MKFGFDLIRSLAVAVLAGALLVSINVSHATAFQSEGGPEQDGDGAAGYIDAIDLLPPSTAGVVRIPSLPEFCDAWQKTQLGELFASPEMKPFVDEQRERLTSYFDTLDKKIGLKPSDLYEIGSGEVVFAWMSFEEDKRHPYSFSIIADIRGMKQKADEVAETIDADLMAGGAERREEKRGDDTIRIYRTKPKPGQLKIEEIVLTWNDDRFIAADREVVVQGLLDVVAGESAQGEFSSRKSYVQVLADSAAAIGAANEKDATVVLQWYAEPFTMGRILREVVEYDRRDDLDVMDLLERQGFGVIEALGGTGVAAGKRFDVLHRGVVLAPGKLVKAARMLQGINVKRAPVPEWPSADSGAFYRVNWDLETAFWAAESLVNDALGEDLFRPMMEGIRDDPEGPQIDVAKDFLPNLDNEVILVTDNTMPAGPESDRMLVALRVKNSDVVANVVQKAMVVEPDAIKLDIAEFDVWKVERGEGDGDDIDAELAALGFGEELEEEETAPLLNHWAIAVVKGKTPQDADYLMFSSHSDLLIKLGKRVRSGATGDGLASTPATKSVQKLIDALSPVTVTFDGFFHPSISLRARYELLRRGELQQSDSLISNILRRIVEEDEDGKTDPIHAEKLPPFAKIKDRLKSGGTFWEKTNSGWSMTGFLMAE